MKPLTPIEITSQWRDQVQAATSHDRQWQYRLDAGRWSVTHVATGRRYWAPGLDQARADTADGTAARVLAVNDPLPDGKPMAKGEHRAICGELSVVDCERMLAELRAEVPYMVDGAARQICPHAVPGLALPARTLAQMLGYVYGGEPYAWVEALQVVRPDLIPPHLQERACAF